jgi:hypothetical protein
MEDEKQRIASETFATFAFHSTKTWLERSVGGSPLIIYRTEDGGCYYKCKLLLLSIAALFKINRR